MPSTATKKKGAKTRGKKTNTTGRKRKPTARKKQEPNGLALEIGILLLLLVSILLLISNLDMGGTVGAAVSKFFFGLMGWMAYLFPFVLFLGSAFYIANRKNSQIGQKMLGLFLLFLFMEGFVHMVSMGYAKGDTIGGYFKACVKEHSGGGVIGGTVSMVLSSAFGTLGTYVVLVIGIIISGIILTQRSFLKPLKRRSEKVYQEAKENRERRREARGRISFEQTDLSKAKPMAVPEKKPQKQEEEKVELDFSALHIQRPDPEELFAAEFSPKEEVPFEMQPLQEKIEKEMTEETPAAEETSAPMAKQEEPIRERKKNPRSSKEEIAEGIEHIEQEISEKETEEKKEYVFPPLELLKRGNRKVTGDSDQHLRETAMKLQTTLHNFGVNVTVTNVSCGPTVTRYELQPEQGVKVSKIVSLTDDIKLNLAAADIRIEAPIPGKAAVGIEVPNATNSAVMLRDLLESREFQEFPSELAFAVGKDIAGKTVVADIGKMPHLLIAGATGSGKSVCINTLIMSLIYKASPEDVKLIMIDPKVVELSVYNGIPHLFIPVVTDPKKAAGALNWAVAEMTERYNKFAQYNVRDLKGYNEKVEQLKDIDDPNKPQKLPKIVIIVDELADLMMVAPGEVEDAICRLAQLARAAGLHLIIATQRPSVNVITGLIKANMPSRIAFSVSSGVDSRTILDMNGAEKLLGKGDMLYYPQGLQKPARLQGSFVSDKEVGQVVEFLTQNHQTSAKYDEKITEMMNSTISSAPGGGGNSDLDVHFVDAGKFIIEKDKASIGMLQRVFKIGFNRAARIMDQLADAGVVGPEEGTKPRKVLMSMEEFENYIEEM